MRSLYIAVILLLFCCNSFAQTDNEIKDILVNRSVSNYKGSCPCPYSLNNAHQSCGKNSAYARSGGLQPLCYRADITKNMIENYRKMNK